MKQTRQPVHAVKQSIYLAVYGHISQILELVELVKSIVATEALLRLFPKPALPVRGIPIRILQWLFGASAPPK